ncbi:type I methionyl aminopeptidase [Candidatus Desantisbacteria bacterium CG_4_10_14_0_8_um_filter_48_22]|uniref:Methionine aminopeptidase n=1 Tax=Candidatus Desantisbacteria bacterium CG_4_10_14_0_8_um_filter_48_22 TaxID=1974543 RepID=A0A2M7S9I7_9BACT|nr:MAG: type I methionyl aminopeptidase [Candidatus Desantisbacteria bacterium CG1_02_49_89]PIV54661.1 MAG: type I methionyl aminopeptidase [Candidatus Desantisbacteria bacterium CG02_land_8_20_14_3_00_49_13]PIZ16161.1 MAG: type I methionyl aminopeptidase [Candidatus Desantisbacteria bacterium CG_4_10_14_0_8_um_filter_48_22]PJB27600.1 MAG: type I methionyl aminopeptidase [Candidatus Desantisbacteria bacterium CG_4_9_14_3_um_filter_50_7]
MINIRSREEIAGIEKACRIAAEILDILKREARAGKSTQFLDDAAQKICANKKARLAFKGYRGFPGNICTSVNDEVVHGIPSSRILEKGDIVGIDVGVCCNGFYGDTAATVGVESISSEAKKLLEATEAALYKGIEKAREGNRLSDISHAVQFYVESRGYSVVRELTGHGIGRNLHEEPGIPNFGPPGKGPVLKKGIVLAIEPMVSQGRKEITILDNGWTVVTRDRSLAAHFEHTISVDSAGPRILTRI